MREFPADPSRALEARFRQGLAPHQQGKLTDAERLYTLPYNVHTTASDALWAGLPVLTCRGQAFAGRVAALRN